LVQCYKVLPLLVGPV